MAVGEQNNLQTDVDFGQGGKRRAETVREDASPPASRERDALPTNPRWALLDPVTGQSRPGFGSRPFIPSRRSE